MTDPRIVLAAEEHVNELPAEPWVFGLLALSVLFLLLLITLTFNRDR